MSRQTDLAFAHQANLTALAHSTAAHVARLWQGINPSDLDAQWDVTAPRMVASVTASQGAAADLAQSYSNAIDQTYGYKAPKTILNTDAFTDVMGDGRELAPALYGAVTNTKSLIGQGLDVPSAFQRGASFLAVIAQEAIASMGRAADLSMMGGKKYTRYIRACAGSACSRCAILEGIWSSDTAFQRHPCCQCVAIPVEVDGRPSKATDREFNPQAFFDSLSTAEQDKRFTIAGAKAIRAGADPVAVVNARRGAYGIGYRSHGNAPSVSRNRLTPLTIGKRADGSPLRVYATVEGTTVRGAFTKAEAQRTENAVKVGRYRRTTTVRLMPEQIMRMAGSNADRARELLTRYGYIN
jgi:hypothetical protein